MLRFSKLGRKEGGGGREELLVKGGREGKRRNVRRKEGKKS